MANQATPAGYSFGQVYWVRRTGWENCGGFGMKGSRPHPGLVTRAPRQSYQPPEMCPGSSKLKQWTRGVIFTCRYPLYRAGSFGTIPPDSTFFYLVYRRPVSKRDISGLYAELDPRDQDQLEEVLAKSLRKSKR